MTWTRLDDGLLGHPKITAAGKRLGRNGRDRAFALYVQGLMFANRHSTDGHLSWADIGTFTGRSRASSVADALVAADLWERNGSGFVIHDFLDFNFSAADVKAQRKKNKQRQARWRSRHGAS